MVPFEQDRAGSPATLPKDLRNRLSSARRAVGTDAGPAQWGVIFTVRTGSAMYSLRFATECRRRGFHVGNGALHEGAAGHEKPSDCQGPVIPTPEERDFFDAVGIPYVEPWERR